MRFDSEAFGWLNDDCQYLPGWSNVSMTELWALLDGLESQGITKDDAPDVFTSVNALTEFLATVGLAEESGPVLGVKIDDGDLIEQVNGPAIFAEMADGNPTGNAVLRVGDNTVVVKFDGKAAKIGELQGDIELIEYGDDTNKSYGVAFEYSSELLDDEVVTVNFVLDIKNRPEIGDLIKSKAKVKKAITSGSLPALLRPVPTGESFVKPRDLQVGEYSVVAISENDPHEEYGRSWKVVLEGIGPMMTTGKRLNATLARQAKIYIKWLEAGNPLTFAISKKEEMSQGIRVDAGFFKRSPKKDRLVVASKAIAPMSSVTVEALPEATSTVTVPSEPVQQGLGVNVPASGVTFDDEIVF